MSESVTALIGIVSGIIGAIGTTTVAHWLERQKENRFAVQKYARPIWLGCDQLTFRLDRIIEKINRNDGEAARVLDWWKEYDDSRKILWMNGHGYYIVSTAYVVSSLSCWFHIMERQVVFLPFRDKSKSTEFFHLVEAVKRSLTTNTPLWTFYLDGIGQMLLDENNTQPITYGEFVLRLSKDDDFAEYFQQLFHGFIQDAGAGKITDSLVNSVSSLRQVQQFLETNATLPIQSLKRDKRE